MPLPGCLDQADPPIPGALPSTLDPSPGDMGRCAGAAQAQIGGISPARGRSTPGKRASIGRVFVAARGGCYATFLPPSRAWLGRWHGDDLARQIGKRDRGILACFAVSIPRTIPGNFAGRERAGALCFRMFLAHPILGAVLQFWHPKTGARGSAKAAVSRRQKQGLQGH